MSNKNRMMVFTIAGEEMDRLEAFMQEHSTCADDVFGGRFEFSFYPCAHGMPKEITCICGETLYLEPELRAGDSDNLEDFLS